MGKMTEPAEIFGGEMNRRYLADEAALIESILPLAKGEPTTDRRIRDTALELARAVRSARHDVGGLQAFLQHYDLSSDEGIVLMCLAEALLRIPDTATADALIADKLTSANWQQHVGESDSVFVNASTWALMLTGKVLRLDQAPMNDPVDLLGKLLARLEEPVLRGSLKAAMGIMAGEFVLGRTIDEAIVRSISPAFQAYRFSFDMLGEAALTSADAIAYEHAYRDAIAAIGQSIEPNSLSTAQPSISVKLSALCPRFEFAQRTRAISELTDRVLRLATLASRLDVALTLDAEEASRLEISVTVFERVYLNPQLRSWSGFGLAVQAYQKRALDVLARLDALSREAKRSIPVRLVKGAYWDSEIKSAQEQGLADYPVFTLKRNTDVSYLACARFLLQECAGLYPQFATHNAHTIAYVYHHGADRDYEFQRLHGMGEDTYRVVIDAARLGKPCRVYAPVGAHEDLLPYLVRRLLENGANTSFVNRVVDADNPIETLIADPVLVASRDKSLRRHPRIPAPPALYLPARRNSLGLNFADSTELSPLFEALRQARDRQWQAAPYVDAKTLDGAPRAVANPARSEELIGSVQDADLAAAGIALESASQGFGPWTNTAPCERAKILEHAADRFTGKALELASLCVLEAGKTLKDSVDEVREAIDFLRYYAQQTRECFAQDIELPGPTGEANTLGFRGRGVFVCISPWNFPVAIFVGQIAAALGAGNTVIAKPAEQTSLVAWRACELLLEAGLPPSALAFLPGDGVKLGTALLRDPRVVGVAFTGSSETALSINRTLAERDSALPTLIAETGGLNAMLVDSSALPEQVVRDVVASAFNSAGQRCSALRVLCIQEEIASRVLELLTGFMDEWVTGDPTRLDTDMGPVIDSTARDQLESYVAAQAARQRLLYRGAPPSASISGYFVAPAIIEIDSISDLTHEVFGPVLHVLRYRARDLEKLLDAINTLGYGLTLGIQSRIESRARAIKGALNVGNVYVNRDMVGAAVGVQPFGGSGLSGTGPKAGGPHYLTRFASEQTFTVNTAAIGGNASLLSADPKSTEHVKSTVVRPR